jgi:ferredoxin-thioredoxin reductase catalytic subunit
MDVEDYLRVFEKIAERRGWRVNPDSDLVRSFAEGLIRSKERYGIAICPCRLATGRKEVDRLIICPCIYAEDDIREYGRCYCGLYVSKDYAEGRIEDRPVPDRHFKYYLE